MQVRLSRMVRIYGWISGTLFGSCLSNFIHKLIQNMRIIRSQRFVIETPKTFIYGFDDAHKWCMANEDTGNRWWYVAVAETNMEVNRVCAEHNENGFGAVDAIDVAFLVRLSWMDSQHSKAHESSLFGELTKIAEGNDSKISYQLEFFVP